MFQGLTGLLAKLHNQSSSVHKINNPTVRLKLENLDWIGSRSVKTGSNQKRSDHFSSHRFGSGHDQTEFKSVYSKFVQNILAEGFKSSVQDRNEARRPKHTEMDQRSRWSRLIFFFKDKGRLNVDSWPAASALLAQA
ncbi:hypothetical protein F2Q69_00027738 [Brassica cretica]|uniref:Uncharacterized protein n=1 Tax=Brassica cretica TaxID=69181 RepID=A0A8S9RWN9_BRACR|nr:hypothetical protein F2Q69_00027738 [Brassica cretica]